MDTLWKSGDLSAPEQPLQMDVTPIEEIVNIKDDKNLLMSMSLLMRLFEWCHEDAVSDVAMHKAMEKIVSFNDGMNPLTIDVYEAIISGANDGQQKEVEDTGKDYCHPKGEDTLKNVPMTTYDDAMAYFTNEINNPTMKFIQPKTEITQPISSPSVLSSVEEDKIVEEILAGW